ncbi:hypothetical protein MRX96_028736 [Rhipicephalus microplus]
MRHRESSWNRRHQGPDGPWAWLVASASAWNLFWLSLVRRSGGVLFVALVSTFGESRERTSWVISLNMSLAMLLGPLWGLLTKVLSLRNPDLVGLPDRICAGIGQGIVMPTKDLAHRLPFPEVPWFGQRHLLHRCSTPWPGSLFYRKPPWAQAQNETEARRNSAGLKARGDDGKYVTGRQVFKTQEAARAADKDHVSKYIDGPCSRKLPERKGDVTDAADFLRNGAEHGNQESNGSCASASGVVALLSNETGVGHRRRGHRNLCRPEVQRQQEQADQVSWCWSTSAS